MKRLMGLMTSLLLVPGMSWAVSAVRSVTIPAAQGPIPQLETQAFQAQDHLSATHIPAEDISAISAIMEDDELEGVTEELDTTMLTATED